MKDFSQIKQIPVEDLILVIANTIIPHKLTFYELIVYGIKNFNGDLLLKL